MASMSSSSELLNEEIEIQALQKSFVKTTKKSNYGSLRKDIPQAIVPIVNFKHRIKPGETLQGISLKYNVPIENIKRSNRLWSNDLALIKDILIVPIRKDKLDELNLGDQDAGEDDVKTAYAESKNENRIDNANKQTSNVDLADYLNKFDNLIIESKIKLKNLENSSNMAQKSNYDEKRKTHSNSLIKTFSEATEIDPDDLFQTRKIASNLKKSSTVHLDSSPNSKLDNSLTSTPDCFIADPVSNDTSASSSNSSYLNGGNYGSRAKLAHKNLLRLEREKDELFEL